MYANTLNFYIDLTSQAVDDLFDELGLTGNIVYSNTTQKATYTFSDASNTASKGCLKLYQVTISGLVYQGQSCANTPSGTAYYNLAYDADKTYIFKGYITRGGNDYLVSTETVNFSGENPDGTNALFYMMIIMLVFAFLFLWDVSIAIVAQGLIPLIFTIAGLIPLGFGITVPVAVLSIVIAVVIGVSRR